MRQSSKTMYRIGRIFSFVLLGICGLLIVLGTILLIVELVRNGASVAIANPISTIISGVIWGALVIAMIILASRAIKDIDADEKNNVPHIWMIVMGAITGDVFYLLGGIFGLVANGQENNNSNNQ